MLIFEQATSPLHFSNDARLCIETVPHPEDVHEDGTPLALPRLVHRVVRLADGAAWHDGGETETVFATLDRVKADAYVAGYDLARSEAYREERS